MPRYFLIDDGTETPKPDPSNTNLLGVNINFVKLLLDLSHTMTCLCHTEVKLDITN